MEQLVYFLDDNIKNRYKTVIENIKNASNSFYDSYNSLVEQFLRSLIDKPIKGSIHDLLNDKDLKQYLLIELNLDIKVYSKLLDYGLKINKHKHRLEKEISLEVVINYMEIFYQLLNAYALNKNIMLESFNRQYLENIYAVNTTKYQSLKEIVDSNSETILKMEKIIQELDSELERKEKVDDKQEYQRRLIRAPKMMISDLSYRIFYQEKDLITKLYLVFAISLTLTIIFACIYYGFLDTFSFFLIIGLIYSLTLVKQFSDLNKENGQALFKSRIIKVLFDSNGIPVLKGNLENGIKVFYYIIQVNLVIQFISMCFVFNNPLIIFRVLTALLALFLFIFLIIFKRILSNFVASFNILGIVFKDEKRYFSYVYNKYVEMNDLGEFR